MGDGFDHFAGDGEEAGMAQVAGVILGCSVSLDRGRLGKGVAYQEVFWRCGGRVQVDGPVHECLAASDGKNDSVHVVDGNGLDDHCFCSMTPVRFNMSFSFFAGGFGVYSLRVLCCKAYYGVRWHESVRVVRVRPMEDFKELTALVREVGVVV